MVRDAILSYLRSLDQPASIAEIQTAVTQSLGTTVPPSSVRSYLNQNQPMLFTRTGRGYYQMNTR